MTTRITMQKITGNTLVLLAGILMIGRYTGYRLSEWFRFKTFADS